MNNSITDKGLKRIRLRISNLTDRVRLFPRLYDYCYFTARTNRRALNGLLSSLSPESGGTVIDLGCGSKPFQYLFPKTFDYIGYDFSADSFPDVVHDLSGELPIPSESADFVILSEALEHLPDPKLTIREVARILRPNGLALITTPFAFPIHSRPHDYYRYTEFFFRNEAAASNLEIVELAKSNSFLTTPFLIMPLVALPIPFVPWWIKQSLSLAVNLFAVLVEFAFSFIRTERVTKLLDMMPMGYAVTFRKPNN
jgi:SAM-dependent methyltransferase